jgi:hypothetical protein
VATETRERTLHQLVTQKLGRSQREVVYPFGAPEGLLLDEINPGWRKRYFAEKFDLSRFYPTSSTLTVQSSETWSLASGLSGIPLR